MSYTPNNNDRFWKEPREEGWFQYTSPLRFIIFLIILIFLIIGGWYLFFPMEQPQNNNEVPLIRVDKFPHKIKAKDQGVPTVKHQDKLIYGRIREDKNNSTVEHILPDPEPPLAQINNETETVKMVEQYQPEDLVIEKSKVIQEVPTKFTSIDDLIDSAAPVEKPSIQQKIVKKSIYIQLGSLKSYDIAETEWTRISKKHNDVLGNFKSTIQKVDLGADQGIYYRLRTGPFESEEAAKEACSTLKERKVECLVIH